MADRHGGDGQTGASSVSPAQQSNFSPSSGGEQNNNGLNALKNLAAKRSSRADGSQPKRRGPKPDSKPALTRRQELNRQAQRTHRERKELYVKALEDEVLRLKEIYSSVSQDKSRLHEENKKLKRLLAENGIPWTSDRTNDDDAGGGDDGSNNNYNASVSGKSYGQGSHGIFSPDQTSQPSTAPSASPSGGQNQQLMSGQQLRDMTAVATKNKGVDYEQAGIEFVLKLERPCMGHLPFLMERANVPDEETYCGHAMMASCPPRPLGLVKESTPYGTSNVPRPAVETEETGATQKTWELSRADLATLMDLSPRIDLDGEVTPITAWGMIMSHPRFGDLSLADFKGLAEELGRKVRCYGFGAVAEEFEVRDALEGVLSTRAIMA
ncbi:uncharacterized protein J7T54_006365 [Emericellopsis cladophorae]|uniref:BZIP domain-containing protein n=1 Tax=Emericellopsis cladophorae TaxID=2686198 RepID=A0A9P9Y9M3_9HYPO|nr:uncharacterized protein J7T54_006365 [Emericellopsis cladophorae]KAI6786026.1 hypothetical protein J7T54_006365 [Emericellopsis cladophorae]